MKYRNKRNGFIFDVADGVVFSSNKYEAIAPKVADTAPKSAPKPASVMT